MLSNEEEKADKSNWENLKKVGKDIRKYLEHGSNKRES